MGTAVALRQKGLHFAGIVKTAHKGFPKKALEDWEATKPQKGETKFMTTKVTISGQEQTLMAADWKSTKPKKIIATCSNGQPGAEHCVPRTKQVIVDGEVVEQKYVRKVPRPKVFEELFTNFSTVDVHDHYRQGTLDLEGHWKTMTWWFRVFTTLMGVIYTDCYFAYYADYAATTKFSEDGEVEYMEFLGQLAEEMVFNHADQTAGRGKGTKRSRATRDGSESDSGDDVSGHRA